MDRIAAVFVCREFLCPARALRVLFFAVLVGFFAVLPSVSFAVTPPAQYAPVITQYAGTGSSGNGSSGTATTVALNHPNNVTLDASGNLYIVDFTNLKIRKVDPSGNLVTLSLSGTAPYGSVTLNSPQGIAVDASGDIYLADQYATSNPSYGYVYKFDASGALLQSYGTAQGNQNCLSKFASTSASTNTSAGCTPSTVLLKSPAGLALDASGNLYIADAGYGSLVEVGSAGATIALVTASLSSPSGLAMDAAGDLYIADYGSNTVKKWSASAGLSTFAGGAASICSTGNTDSYGDGCPATQAKFSTMYQSPRAVAVDRFNNVYISDPGNGLLRVVTADDYMHSVNGSGTVLCSGRTDSYGNGCPVSLSKFNFPAGIAIDAIGNVYLADQNDYEVRKITFSDYFLSETAYAAGSSSAGSVSQMLTFLFNNTKTLNATTPYAVVTQGATGLDFQPQTAAAGTCMAGATYNSGATCTVNVTFAPHVAGLRAGAVLLYDNAATPNLLATSFLSGTGNASSVAFDPGTQTAIGSGFTAPSAVAVDGAGNVYVADGSSSGRLMKIASAASATTLAVNSTAAFTAVALDGAGDIYYAAKNASSIEKLSADGSLHAIGSGLTDPRGMAVDAQGNVYVADGSANKVYRMAADGSTQVAIGSGFNNPVGLAFNAAGDLYVVNSGDGTISKISADGVLTTVATGLTNPEELAVDAAGNLYITAGTAVEELPADGSGTRTIISALGQPSGLALDAAGNLYVSDAVSTNPQVIKLDRADAPTLHFADTVVGSTSSDSPQSVQMQNIGNESLTADNTNPAVGLTVSSNFQQVAGSSGVQDCSTSFVLSPGAACDISISFAPSTAGTNTGAAVTLTDDALNGAPSHQSISLNGTGTQPMVSVAIASAVSPNTTFTYGTTPSITVSLSPSITGVTISDFAATLDGAIPLSVSTTGNANIFSVLLPATPLSAGNHQISISFSGYNNYSSSSAVIALTVSKASLQVAAASASMQYGGALPVLSGTLTGVVAEDGITASYSTTAT
ncbi:MAG: NHL repeat-containing protein, partial [Acidobacteriaceae bacterium]